MNVLYASQCQAAPTNPASSKFSKTTFFPQFPQPLCPQLLVSSLTWVHLDNPARACRMTDHVLYWSEQMPATSAA